MSILDNEGHDPQGFGNQPGLQATIERLTAERDRMREALIQVRGFCVVMGPHNWRDLRLHISRQCDVLNSSPHPTPETKG